MISRNLLVLRGVLIVGPMFEFRDSMLGGLFGRNGNPALRLCGIMQKHHGVLADF